MSYAKAFEYKQWANQELLAFGERQLAQLPENDAVFFIRILNHTAVVDSLFISRILAETEGYDADNTEATPTLAELSEFIAQQDAWLVDYTKSISEQELKRVVSFTFTDGDSGQLTVEEILLHLLTHGSNHRGMAARTLATKNLDRPSDTFTRFLHESEPFRRETKNSKN